MSADDYGEPFTVQRLRGMVANLHPDIREHSTTAWAADEIDSLRAELAALKARRCDGCDHAWRTDDFPPERPGYMWCGLVNHRHGNEAPMVLDARHLGLSVPQVHPSHSCAAWTEKP